jgi:hypothetical protein
MLEGHDSNVTESVGRVLEMETEVHSIRDLSSAWANVLEFGHTVLKI